MFDRILPYVLAGISVGGQYALIAVGYTMVYGILRLINFAHGDIFTAAGFFMVYLTASLPMGLSIPLVIILTIVLGFTLEDRNGDPCPTEYISCSQDTVKATLPIRAIKNVPLTVNLIYGSGANETNTIVTVTPSYLTLTGDTAILSEMNQIVLGTVDLTDFNTTFTEEYSIPLDNSLKNLTGLSTAEVTVEVVGLDTKPYRVTNITFVNTPENSDVEAITETLEVRIRGTEEQLKQIRAENITLVADLTDYQESVGAYMVPVRVRVDGFTDVGAVGDYTISVEIRKAEP